MWVDHEPVDDGHRSVYIIHFKPRFNPQFKYMTFMYQHHKNVTHDCSCKFRSTYLSGNSSLGVGFHSVLLKISRRSKQCCVYMNENYSVDAILAAVSAAAKPPKHQHT